MLTGRSHEIDDMKGGVTISNDGDGNRVSETVAGVTTNYVVDTQNPTGYAQVIDELQNGIVTENVCASLLARNPL